MGLPIRELMWGMPGSMLAAIHMAEMTGETRWRGLFETQAARLLGALEDTPQGPLWTQDLYGANDRWLGPVHGFPGSESGEGIVRTLKAVNAVMVASVLVDEALE